MEFINYVFVLLSYERLHSVLMLPRCNEDAPEDSILSSCYWRQAFVKYIKDNYSIVHVNAAIWIAHV